MPSFMIAERNKAAAEAAALGQRTLPETLVNSERVLRVLEQKRQYPYRGFVDVRIGAVAPFVMFCNNDDPVALHYFWLGADAWEPVSLRLWHILCAEAKGAVLDVGAFSGLYSLVAFKLGCRNIVAFEPSRMPLVRLLDNLNANGALSTVTVVPKAASDYEGTASFNLIRALATLSTGGKLDEDEQSVLKEPVLVSTVDKELASLGLDRVSLIKVDVEGAEVSALMGMLETVREHKPDIVIEVKPSLVKDIAATLRDFGYAGAAICEDTGTLREIEQNPQRISNYLFCAGESRMQKVSSKLKNR